jgi:hypothetical protein
MAKSKKPKRRGWNDADVRAFADGVRLRSTTFADQRKESSRRACRTKVRALSSSDF